MNGRASIGDEPFKSGHSAGHKGFTRSEGKGAMTSGMTAFLVAVGGMSVACYLLMNRAQNRGVRRQSAGNHGTSTGTGSSAGWNLTSWFAGGSSCSDNSGTSCESSGGDSGGDGGGGGD